MLLNQQWDPDLVEARYIKDLEDNLSIIRLRFGDSSKPLFRNREFIVYERRETMEDGTLVSSTTKQTGRIFIYLIFSAMNLTLLARNRTYKVCLSRDCGFCRW
jgi:hypothetical protein